MYYIFTHKKYGQSKCESRPGLIGGWTASGRAELGRPGLNRAASFSLSVSYLWVASLCQVCQNVASVSGSV